MKKETYTQCEFKNGNRYTVGFIPTWAARIGNQVQLLEFGEDFWEVTLVGQELERSDLLNIQKNSKRIHQKDMRRNDRDKVLTV